MFTDRSALLGKSKTEMRLVRALDNILKKIVFGIFVILDILQDEMLVDIISHKHIFLVRAIRGQGEKRIISIAERTMIKDATREVTGFIKFVGIDKTQEMSTVSRFVVKRMLQIQFRD